jgi:hypothetical protein
MAPIVFLHGFGSTKEDCADFVHHAAFDGRPSSARWWNCRTTAQ